MLEMDKMYFWGERGKTLDRDTCISCSWKRNQSVSHNICYFFKLNFSQFERQRYKVITRHLLHICIPQVMREHHSATCVGTDARKTVNCTLRISYLHPRSCVWINFPNTVHFWTIHLLLVLCKDNMCIDNLKYHLF